MTLDLAIRGGTVATAADIMARDVDMFRICSRNLYGWMCDHESVTETVEALDEWNAWDDYPASWPRNRGEKRPMSVVHLTPEMETRVKRRRATVRRDLENAGSHYPRDDVQEVLAYWHVEL